MWSARVIVNFPEPYPGEPVYGLCSRYSQRMQYPSAHAVVKDLFCTRNVTAVVDMPGHLDRLVSSLSPGYSVSADQLIVQHTLFPYYTLFLPQGRREQVRADMRGSKGRAVHMRTG